MIDIARLGMIDDIMTIQMIDDIMIDDLMTIQKSHSDHDRMNIVCSELFQ